ncbi:unnamed protein product [Diamesa tonsa]
MKEIKIPIIQSDLRHEEVHIQAIKIFEYLDAVVDQTFDRIDARISQNMGRIKMINQRIETAHRKIESFKESKKAITIFSPAKYPMTTPAKFKSTFADEKFNLKVDYNYKLDNPGIGSVPNDFADKLQFFHVNKGPPKNAQPNKRSLIYNTKSINSIITFVNSENIIINDPVVGRKPELSHHKDNVDSRDDTKDFSRFSTLMRNKGDGDNFNYSPNMNSAPELLELPMDLPDLPGIAGDISFNFLDAQQSIAPSMMSMNIIGDLPDLFAEESKVEPSTSKTIDVPDVPSQIINVPPPPPPIPMNLPPPPPPPPMIIQQQLPGNKTEQKAPPSPAPDDARSSLMQAIRNAAGKSKLRAAAEEMPTNKKPPPPPAGDLMSDLHQKLMLRRKGIAGNKQSKKERASSSSSTLMDKVSLLIPPPPKNLKKSTKVSSDDDGSDTSNSNSDEWES